MSSMDLARQLLEFGRAPGRYALRLGEPRQLHAELDTVAQWATGRLPDHLQQELNGQAHDLVAAAVLFVQRVCFAAGNTHYQVLGLTPESFSPELLRTRYRSLIRLTHPDMGVQGLPANAAGLINRAQDVLGSEQSRQEYDEQLRRAAVQGLATGPVSDFHGAASSHGQHRRHGVPRAGRGHERGAANEQPRGLGAQWLRIKTRYPQQWRIAMVAACASTVVAVLVVWLAADTQDHSLLAIHPPLTKQPSGDVLTARSGPQGAAVAPAPAGRGQKPVPAERPVAVKTEAAPPGEKKQPVAADGLWRLPHEQHVPARLEWRTGNGRSTAPYETVAAAAPPTSPAVPIEQGTAAVTNAVALAPPPAPASALMGAAKVPAAPALGTPPPVASAPVMAAAAQAAAPAPAPTVATPAPAPVWSVDAGGAKQYLSSIVGTFENGAEAQRLHAYLASMQVKGSLLQPLLGQHGRGSGLQVQRSAWKERAQPGALNIQTTVILQPRSGAEAVSSYLLVADFRGTKDGAMLERLDLRPEQ